ncbi:MAG: hypothetical protein K6E20_07310 [Acholeplasmatales bacterium]|nr:hypothetical protein [Acholeplasmatales bacterium]
MNDNNNEEKLNNEFDIEGGNKLSKRKLTKKERAQIESQKDKEYNKNNPKKKTDYVYNPKRGRILQLIFFLLMFGLLFLVGWLVRGCMD